MLIANPLYDSAFKYLMQDFKVASHFISVILNRDVEVQGFESTEDVLVNEQSLHGFSTHRMDFNAIITEYNGTTRKVLIELQKSHTSTDISRFRRYLAKSYYDSATLPKNNEHVEIISIYILGFKLNLPVAVVRTSTQLIDAHTQELLDANTDDDVFMRKLHHESVFIDTTKLTHKMQNRVDRLLMVFNQNYITENKYELDIPDDAKPLNEDALLMNRLNYALLDAKVRHELSVQVEYQKVIDKEYREFELKGRIDGRLEGKLEGKLEIAKGMKMKGLDMSLIVELTGLSEQEISKL